MFHFFYLFNNIIILKNINKFLLDCILFFYGTSIKFPISMTVFDII